MKKKAIICLAIVMFLMGTMQTFAEENSAQNYSITTPYEFEVQPGDDEWKNLFTTEEMINACQIPETIMKKMTTSALIKTMLSNSFILDFQTCNDSLYAMEMLEKNFNVFRELQTRTDYMDELLSIYNETELVSEDMLDEDAVSTHFFDVFNLEVLIAYEINKSDDISLQKADGLKIMDDITSIYGVKCADRLEASDIYTANADGFVWFKENVKTEIEETTISVLATTSTTELIIERSCII